MVLFRYDHCTTHHNPQLALQRLRWKEWVQVIAEDLTSHDIPLQIWILRAVATYVSVLGPAPVFGINTSWTQISHVLDNNYISSTNIVKKHDLYQNVSKLVREKNVQAVSTLQFDKPQSGTFPTTSRQVNSLALRCGYHLSLLNSAGWSGWNFAWKYPTWCKKNMEKGISTNSIPCSLLVDVSGGVASFCKVYRSNSQRYQNRAYPHSHKQHKTSFRLHDESVG